jgi:hypothetical protein
MWSVAVRIDTDGTAHDLEARGISDPDYYNGPW